MGFLKVTLLISLMVAAISWFIIGRDQSLPDLPQTWWRPGNEKTVDEKIRPFKVTFTKDAIEDLKNRLRNTRELTPSLAGVGWSYGTTPLFLKRIIDHWLNKYDFGKRENILNEYPQFKTNIQGLDIHFIHAKPKDPKGKRVIPLLLLHGWPSSTVELRKVLPLLTTPKSEYDFVFEVIGPSLPGFGFSDAATIPGLGAPQMAVVLKNLMLRLGFEKFYAAGGDWGSIITADMATLFPQHVLGIYCTMCMSIRPWTLFKALIYSFLPLSTQPIQNHRTSNSLEYLRNMIEESGYFHIQATKPDTIGVGLNDSPAGMAAYYLEKFPTATNYAFKSREDGGIQDIFSMDDLIDNVMMYWISKSATTAARIYAETYSKAVRQLHMGLYKIEVPSACPYFPHEIVYQPPWLLKDRYVNLIRTTPMPRGGHFAMLEEPKLFSDDMWETVSQMEKLKSKE